MIFGIFLLIATVAGTASAVVLGFIAGMLIGEQLMKFIERMLESPDEQDVDKR